MFPVHSQPWVPWHLWSTPPPSVRFLSHCHPCLTFSWVTFYTYQLDLKTSMVGLLVMLFLQSSSHYLGECQEEVGTAAVWENHATGPEAPMGSLSTTSLAGLHGQSSFRYPAELRRTFRLDLKSGSLRQASDFIFLLRNKCKCRASSLPSFQGSFWRFTSETILLYCTLKHLFSAFVLKVCLYAFDISESRQV